MLTWVKEWNNIIRYTFFKDEPLKKLMKIPTGTGIILFVEKYFIRAGYSNKLLESEDVRIVYSDVSSSDTAAPNIRRYLLQFDIYVKNEVQRTATPDRLLLRTDLIAERLKYLLTDERYTGPTGYRFWPAGEMDLGTRTVGYTRHMVSFYFLKVE